MPYAAINRRALLGGAAAVALPVLLGGCAAERRQVLRPLPDVAVVTAAITQEEALIALYEAGLAQHTSLARAIEPFLAHHREHLSVLRGHLRPGTDGRTAAPSPTGSTAGSATGPSAAPVVPGSPAKFVAVLRTAERKAAIARILDVERVKPGVAQLLASIGGCEAGHAAALIGVT